MQLGLVCFQIATGAALTAQSKSLRQDDRITDITRARQTCTLSQKAYANHQRRKQQQNPGVAKLKLKAR